MKKFSINTIFAFATLLGFLSCGQDQKEAIKNTSNPISVVVAKVAANDDNSPLIVSGSVEATNSASISTRLMGYVEQINVKVGDKVTKGQVVIAINSSDLQAKRAQVDAGITEAKAAFLIAEKDYNRYKNLFEQNSASQKELDDITAHYKMAKARLESAQQMKNEINAQFAYTNVKAPFSGIITGKYIDEGSLANPGMPLLAIEAPNNFEVVTRVPEAMISKINNGETVTVTISSIDTELIGKVTEVSTSSKYSGGQYLAKVTLDTKNDNIRSGMFASVHFPNVVDRASNSDASILIPKTAIITNGQLEGVYTVSQQKTAVLRWLRLGKSFNDKVEVLSGLSSGEEYILSADEKLYNGAKLSIK
ncbi:efflux RND transporter periplasmic adaptor subunit [Winogradskyella alexanderae]|uniref:Efflux RND transporter periplasmic adaptor subunit n=1 Tax=Winogradskyella alexanderae TaxID=2877123 RepID=A0ABS7XNW9_9FLAO|nr:efflux RND transporter periplasmic adaptor subunit [Winogradskyella alexanderae]MCA0131686.1 efflux RND transporter periplasmic adaptor subunit [Winogradskyella alexanderae]